MEFIQHKVTAVLLFSGLLEYDNTISIPEDFTAFSTHIENENSDFVIPKVIKHLFHETFVDNLLPESVVYKNNSYHLKCYTKSIDKNYLFSYDDKVFNVDVKYLDLYVFDDKTLIYSIKTELNDFPLGAIPVFNRKIRAFDFENDSVFQDIFLSLNKLVINPNPLLAEYLDYLPLVLHGNKLKSYLLLLEKFDYPEDYKKDNLLFDLATCNRVLTLVGRSEDLHYRASNEYYTDIINKSKITVFDDWTALALFDSFVYIQKDTGRGLNVFQWEHLYFRFIYINAFYVQNYLSNINNKFRKEINNEKLIDKFIDFDKKYILNTISYNFLPNLIYKQINKAFGIDNELELLHQAIERENYRIEKNKDTKLNMALFVITILSMLSAFKDWSDWLTKIDFANGKGFVFHFTALFPIIGAVVIIAYFLFRKK